jgi:gamma-glutamyltranspeptidase/glutathione hydrolase
MGAALLGATAAIAQTPPPPELPSGWTPKEIVYAKHDTVTAANPLAVDAGRVMLALGGSAVDAAIAVQMVLNLVEPQSSGIGGGAFLLHYDARHRRVESYDGRETAPAEATPQLFLGPTGTPLPFAQAVVGGRSVGTPGTLRLLELAHRDHGRLPWALLFAPAIKLAHNGFEISPRLAGAIAGAQATLCTQVPARDYFCNPDGTPKTAGTVLRNPDFADTLWQIARFGVKRFYTGPIAQDIVATVRGHPTNPGLLNLADLANYRAKKREPICGSYRHEWKICGMGMPSSGGATVLQTLGILEHFDVGSLTPQTAPAVHLISEAYRLAYADRAKYMADSDFVFVPVPGLIDKDYLRSRAALIDLSKSMGAPQPGTPPGAVVALGADDSLDLPGTSHMSIIDRRGNVVSMTTTIESGFGSYQFVRGFLLNNELTDFSFAPNDAAGVPIANRVEPGKRPRSSMSPTIVLDRHGNVKMVIGSPGGSTIIQYVTKTLIGVLDWGLDIQQAINLGNFGAQTTATTTLERGSPVAAADVQAGLRALGHTVAVADQNSGLHGITVQKHGPSKQRLAGGADPRREGVARGDSRMPWWFDIHRHDLNDLAQVE